MKDFAMEVIQSKRREAVELGPDLLSRFIEKGDTSDTEMVDIVINFMLAGRDTTASALSWTVWEMLRNPDTIVKLRDEIDTLMADRFGTVRVFDVTLHSRMPLVFLSVGCSLPLTD
jgi:cytochrome P450